MSVRYQTDTLNPTDNIHRQHMQKPSPRCKCFFINNCKSQRQNLLICIYPHSNQQLVFVLCVKMCSINTYYFTTILEPIDTWLECPEYIFQYFLFCELGVDVMPLHNCAWIPFLQSSQILRQFSN